MAVIDRKIRLAPGWRAMEIPDLVRASADYNEGRERIGGHVYFIGADAGAVKIGHSTKLHARLRALKNSSPVSIHLLAAVPGDVSLERKYHQRFAGDRLHGEWFNRSPAILAEIERLRRKLG